MVHKINVAVSCLSNQKWRNEVLKQKRTFVTAQHMQSSAARVLQRQFSGFHCVSS